MRSSAVAYYEKDHLIRWQRTEDNLVGSLQKLYFNMRYTGCFECKKTFYVHRHGIPAILLLLTLEGEGNLRYCGKDYRLTPGSAMLIDLQKTHEYYALDDGWKFKYLDFHGAMSKEYYEYITVQFGPVFSLQKRLFLNTEKLLDEIFRETDRAGTPDYSTVSLHIYSILSSFLSLDSSGEHAPKSASVIHRAAAYMAENYTKNITTQDVADAVYLSRSYMSEQFARIYRVPPHEYLTMYRLSCVKESLTTTSASISEIAEQTGFSDVFALSRVFRRKFGISPTEYRKQFWADRKKE